MRVLLLLPALGLVAGCATMNADECRSADWRTIGFEDGAAGRPLEHIARHRKACAKHEVTPDMAAYEAGHAKGLRRFCTPRNGYDKARAGVELPADFCPPDLAPAFLQGYASGRVVRRALDELYRAEREYESALKAIDNAVDETDRISALLAEGGLTEEERAGLVEQMKAVIADQLQLEAELPRLEAQVASKQRRLERVEAAQPRPQ